MTTKKNSPEQQEDANLAQKAYKSIRKMLFHGEIVPGQKIPYRDLSKKLGMSPTPVIQALKWLEFQGLVRQEPNRGCYVEPFSLDEVSQVYDLRQVLELNLLPEALMRMNEEDETALKKALDDHLKADRASFLNERLLRDMEFHLALASIARWHVHLRILKNLYDLLYLKYRGNYLSARPAEIVDREHEVILKAVLARDITKARDALAFHLTNVKKEVIDNLERMITEKKTTNF
ncbi:MAG: GntR family transcriptional regulator [Deltaproteobacteria bacterium]|nr:GntR family transcriptional regulator [Deltaproteobacteria bacterium]